MSTLICLDPEMYLSPAVALQGTPAGGDSSKSDRHRMSKHEARVGAACDSDVNGWLAAGADWTELEGIGFKLSGEGVHQSKTMMLGDLAAIMAVDEAALRSAILKENVLGPVVI